MKTLQHLIVYLLFISISACSEDNQWNPNTEIPTAISSDFAARYKAAKITNIDQNIPTGFFQINFINENKNETSSIYLNEIWEMTYTKLADIEELPAKVRQAFREAGYINVQTINDVYKIDRKDLEWSTYTIHFLYPTKQADKVTHNVIIDNDGLLLKTQTSSLNDQLFAPMSTKDQQNFIFNKYKGAEIRGYLHNFGRYEYLVYHNNVIKSVLFEGENSTEPRFWKETEYEINLDSKIPDNVLKELKRADSDFTYTNIYLVETPTGNTYKFIDKKTINDFGYCISDQIGNE